MASNYRDSDSENLQSLKICIFNKSFNITEDSAELWEILSSKDGDVDFSRLIWMRDQEAF